MFREVKGNRIRQVLSVMQGEQLATWCRNSSREQTQCISKSRDDGVMVVKFFRKLLSEIQFSDVAHH